ncbi:MAG: hypothetical protein Satyrvirus18_4 [Satyrvirus sp.]|uniref:Uncharacterized protein n=1 Tax=Satyrvirus sp. TaxID=2487771 RepID=A0A3G5AE67_9VIRU|nr:MAG: hypothetical protein Satyrvirus18_4 [Satyrvirus sp.]
MPVDDTILLYNLANTFHTIIGIDICDNTKAYMKTKSKIFSKMETSEKIYYTKYSIQIVQNLIEYFEKISLFELNVDPDDEIVHDFRLTWKKNNVARISLNHAGVNINNIIPKKLMKICKYKRNTKISKKYTTNYNKLNDNVYKKIKTKDKYSELNDKKKHKTILEPFCDLVMNTLSKKRKCSENLYNYLFDESDRIVLKLYKNRFVMYDFGIELDNVESFRMKISEGNEITITFNNKAKFVLCLQTNATEIKPQLSLKFHTTFKNIDDLFMVKSSTI